MLSSVGYSGAGGAAGHATSASVAGGTYSYSASYDTDLRLSSFSVTNTSSGATLFSSQRGYDAVGNVTAVGTSLAAGTGGTDNQVFCYDDQHQLTWAGSVGTPNCGASLTPGSLTAANYTQTYTYDTLDRLQSGPLGSYSYGDTAHLHAVTSIANGGTTAYSASYDAGGNMICRAPTSSTTCAGAPTGAILTFDDEGRLSGWQNTPSAPTTTDSFLYDGAGNRVEQQTTTNGSIITRTVYVAGGLEEITTSGATTTLTKYFGAAALPTAERVGTNGPVSYLASDGQGTVSETLDSSGNVTSAQLYTPYGNVRYSSGSSPTSLGYTGQRSDATTGLDYYHARYYDPVAGQFASAGTVRDGLNRYGYVADNPTTATDPSGHRRMCDHDCWTPPPPSKPNPTGDGDGCHSDSTCGCYTLCSGGGGGGGGGSGFGNGNNTNAGGGGGGPRKRVKDGIPSDAIWSYRGEGYIMYMKDIESDGASGRHFNFHIIHDGIERYNLHFKYVPPNDNCIYRWIATNYLDGEASKFELATPSYPEVDPPSFTASNAAQHFIWEISALTGTYGLNVETTHSALLLQMGDLLYQLAT